MTIDQLLRNADPLPNAPALADARVLELLTAAQSRAGILRHEFERPATDTASSAGTRRRASRTLRLRIAVLAGVASTVVATVIFVPHLFAETSSAPLAAGRSDARTGGPVFGQIPFTVAEDVSGEQRPGASECLLTIHLSGPASPATIALPCQPGYIGRKTEQTAPLARVDNIKIAGKSALITSGTVPAGTSTVTAVSQDGTPLTATLVRPPFMNDVVFVIRSRGHIIRHLKYTLRNGEASQENSVSDR